MGFDHGHMTPLTFLFWFIIAEQNVFFFSKGIGRAPLKPKKEPLVALVVSCDQISPIVSHSQLYPQPFPILWIVLSYC